MRDVYSTLSKCRATHKNLTLPWNDGGCRILPAAMFMKYSEAMRKAKTDYEEAVNEFLKGYPDIIEHAHERLGNLLKGKTFPSAAEIKHKFGVIQEIYPLPDSSDFRVDLAGEDVKEIRNQMKISIDTTIQKAMTDIWLRLAGLIEKVEQTLKQPKKVFRDSLINNLKDFCELIPKLNLTNDTQLESIRQETVKRLAQLKPDNLREGKQERKAAAKTAKEVLEKMKAYTDI